MTTGIILIALLINITFSQTPEMTEADTSKSSILGKIVLGISAAVLIPITIGLTVLSLIPPGYSAVIDGERIHGGIAFETAIGYGDSIRFRFSNYRYLIQYIRSSDENLKNRIVLGYSRDFLLRRFGRHEIFGIGFSVGIAGFTNFIRSHGIGLEFSIWLGNAMNIPYLFLFPQHHIFFRLRRNFDLTSGGKFTEINIGISSAITLRR